MKFEERYKLQVPVEQSERGTLWSGQDTKLSRKVVVAVVEADAPDALRERFAAQMGKLAALRHANVVRVLEVGRTEEDAPFASLELAEGDTLAKRMAEGPPMRADQAIRMIADLCGGLSALHAAGIAHGDIHPGNVLVKELGGRVTPKLAGVGLNGAEQRRGDDEAEDLLALAYMAPAQARGEVLADAASDVYSTAAMVFSLLTGRLPHRGGSAEALRSAVKDRPAPSASDVRAELAGPIGEVLDLALSPDPAKRFDTADALAKGLRAALIRTRTPGAIETVVGARALEADASDVELAEKRMAPKVAAAPGRSAKLAASKGTPLKPLPKPSKEPVEAAAEPTVKVEPPATEPASAAEPGAPASDEALEFERLSGLLDVSEVFAAAAKPPPPPPEADKPEADKPDAHEDHAPSAKGKDDSLEFERLSGLLEIGKLEKAALPPPPPSAASASDDADEAPVEAVAAPAVESAGADEGAGGAPEPAAEAPADDVEPAPLAKAPPEVTLPAATAATGAAAAKEAAPTDEPAKEASPKDAPAKDAPVSAAKDTAAKAPPKQEAAAKRPAKDATPKETAAKAVLAKDAEVFEAEEIAGMTSGPPPWVWAAVGVGLAAAIVVGVVVVSSGDDPGEETALAEPPPTDEAAADPVEAPDEGPADLTAAAALPSPTEASDPEPSPADEAPVEEPAAPQVTLTLTGVPAGATVTVDGEAVEGTEIALASSEAARTIAVRLDGHEDWSRSVPGDSSADVRVELVEIAEAEEPPPPPRASPRRPSRTERAGAQRSRERARPERARPQRARTPPPRRTGRRPGSRPTAVSDPGF